MTRVRSDAGLLITPTPIALDSRGRQLEVGDEVVLRLLEPYFRIREIKPHLSADPRIPPGMIEIVAICHMRVLVGPNQIDPQLLRVQTRAEIEEKQGVPAPPPNLTGTEAQP